MGVVYGGITSKSKQIHMRLKSWQPVPALRNNYVTVPNKAGVADFGCTGAERYIDVQCSVFPQKDFAALVGVLDDMAEWLNPDNGLQQLMFNEVSGRYYTARLAEAVDCERLIRSASNFILRFVCPDPHAYAVTDEIFTFNQWGPYEITRTKGNTNSEPIYYFRGVSGSVSIMNARIITNEDELILRATDLGALETLVIDSGKVTAKIVNDAGETVRNGLPHLVNFNFPILRKGRNTIQTSGIATQHLEIRIQAMSRWR
jgi:predicted phage tail component-like protein